ncbi:MAG: ATP phosphoribosyltransferase regulatory subunit, partial [Paracoccaceae bacterium]
EIGIGGLSIDLSSPSLAAALVAEATPDPGEAKRLREALNRKDAAGVARHGGRLAATLGVLLRESGEAGRALAALGALSLTGQAGADANRLADVVGRLRAWRADLSLTVDLIENRGFEYHTGLCFTIFARDVRGELGRGGRYVAGADFTAAAGESATGFTIYTDTILRALPAAPQPRAIFVAADEGLAARLRDEGWTTVAALGNCADIRAEARRLGCTHALIDDRIVELGA